MTRKMNAPVKTLWMAALESGEYTQGRDRLHRIDGSMCCLGVLCDLYTKTTGKGAWVASDDDGYTFDPQVGDVAASWMSLPAPVAEWAGLIGGIPFVGSESLAKLNDGDEETPDVPPLTFAEISAKIGDYL